jgi:hypothetical protein
MDRTPKLKRWGQYAFPPTLGPADPHPVGSVDFTLCLGNEMDYTAEQVIDLWADRMLPLVWRAIDTKAWLQWDPPEPDLFFRACTGLPYEQIYNVIDALVADHGLPGFYTLCRDYDAPYWKRLGGLAD